MNKQIRMMTKTYLNDLFIVY